MRPHFFLTSVKYAIEKNLLSDVALAVHSGIKVEEILADLLVNKGIFLKLFCLFYTLNKDEILKTNYKKTIKKYAKLISEEACFSRN